MQNWSLTSAVPGRLRLVIHVARGWAPELACQLRSEGISCPRVGPYSVRVEQAASLVTLLKRLLPTAQRRALAPLLDEYARLYTLPLTVRGAKTPVEVREQRREVVRKILERLPAPAREVVG